MAAIKKFLASSTTMATPIGLTILLDEEIQPETFLSHPFEAILIEYRYPSILPKHTGEFTDLQDYNMYF